MIEDSPACASSFPGRATPGPVLRLLPERPRVVPTHPLGCHRERLADRLVFEHVVASVHGSGYERIAGPGCSDHITRRHPREWAALGLAEQVHHGALEARERMIGLDLEDLAADVCLPRRQRAARWRDARRWIEGSRA